MITLRSLRLLMLFSGLLPVAWAQSVQPMPLSTFGFEQAQRWVVKFAPFSLVDPSNTIQFGVERLVGRRQSVQLELGYGWQGMNLWDVSQKGQYSNLTFLRVRAEWRYYWHGGPIGSYMALEGLYKQANAYESGTIGLGCQTGQCQYYQVYTMPISKYVWGGHIKFGRQFSLSANHRLLGDFYGGFGIRGRTVNRFSGPAGSVDFHQSGQIFIDPFTSSPNALLSLSYGLKLGYSF